jgi:hypothetical protein
MIIARSLLPFSSSVRNGIDPWAHENPLLRLSQSGAAWIAGV